MLRNRTLKGSGRDGARRVNRGVNTIPDLFLFIIAAAAAVVVLVWFP